jgi:eukaryotic-like serine/threonine-protein kinase
MAGTPNYIAPEIILSNKTSCKSDIFSIGSILYFLLSGKLAFAYKNVEYTLLRTARG